MSLRVIMACRTSTNNQKFRHLTELLRSQFRAFDPQSLFSVLQMKYPWFTVLCDRMDLERSCGKIYKEVMAFVEDSIEAQSSGTYN